MIYGLSRCTFSRVLCTALLVCVFVALGDDRAEAEEVLASWYGKDFAGLPTASGEPFDPHAFTAAHKTLPLGTELLVSYEGTSVPVTINDRGPYAGARELDLSLGAARSIGLQRTGVDYVDLVVTDFAGDGYSEYPTAGYPAADYAAGPYVGDGAYAAATGTPDAGGAYVVRSGDTLSGIAAELGTTVEGLAAANGIPDPDVLFAGQTLYY